jgi:hypothetical protein
VRHLALSRVRAVSRQLNDGTAPHTAVFMFFA